jgi:competence protein ComEA
MSVKNKKENFLREFMLILIADAFIFAGLTGCGNRTTEFLSEEISEEASEEESEEGKEASDLLAGEAEPTVQEALPEETEIYVDVCGAVVNPGVYCLEGDSRVFQAIDAAGGYLPQAAQGVINRARTLEDGQMIYVPTQEEVENGSVPAVAVEETGESTSGDVGAAADSRINLNTADETTLTSLNGIGEAKARAIIAYREANGPFGAIEDIMNVEGIKEGTFSKIKDEITVE